MKKDDRKLTMQEMSHIRATPSLKLLPNHIDRLLDRISPAQLAHRAARPHNGGKGLGLQTSATTAREREKERLYEGRPVCSNVFVCVLASLFTCARGKGSFGRSYGHRKNRFVHLLQ